jgi:hypothetical protein
MMRNTKWLQSIWRTQKTAASRIFRVHRNAEEAPFNHFRNLRKLLLWHGTRIRNVGGIFTNGLTEQIWETGYTRRTVPVRLLPFATQKGMMVFYFCARWQPETWCTSGRKTSASNSQSQDSSTLYWGWDRNRVCRQSKSEMASKYHLPLCSQRKSSRNTSKTK